MTHKQKRTVSGVFVRLLFHQQIDRGMRLIEYQSRCVRKGEVHELVTTDQKEAISGDRIDRVGFLGFVEILCAGVIEKGDLFWVGDNVAGTVLGFDDCHFPNHYNILIAVDRPITATDLRIKVESEVRFGLSNNPRFGQFF